MIIIWSTVPAQRLHLK